MKERNQESTTVPIGVELSDEDIYDAMSRISGYVDITTEDFREIYHLAFRHAAESLMGRTCARDLMQPVRQTVSPEMGLDKAARTMARHGLKTIPVVDGDNRVVGILSEADYLKRLGVNTFMGFLIELLDNPGRICEECHQTTVATVMSVPPVTVPQDGDFQTLLLTFKDHPVRRVPVVDDAGKLRGIIARKDFISTCRLETLE